MRPTTITKKLLLLSVANVLLASALWVQKPSAVSTQPLWQAAHGHVGADSSEFLSLAWKVAHTGAPLYRTLLMEQHRKFQYPTSSLLIGYVAAWLRTSIDRVVQWTVLVSAVLTLWFAGEVFLLALPGAAGYRWQVRALVASLGVFFYPLINSVSLGQIQTLLTFLFTLAVWCWLRERKVLAGVCLALACAFKPPLALFLLWGVWRRQWKFVGAFLAVAVVVQALAVAAFGWQHEMEYLGALSYLSRHGESIRENQSVNGWLQRLTRNGLDAPVTDYFPYPPYNAVVYVGTLLSTALLLGFALVVPWLRRWQGTATDFVVFGLVSTIASPIVWVHHYGVFYVGCLYLLAMFIQQRGAMPMSFVVCFLLLANQFNWLGRYGAAPWVNWLYSYDLYAGLGVVFLLTFGLRHGRQNGPGALTEGRV